MSPETVMAIRALGWTILHSLWQGAIAAICIRIVLSLMPARAARLRYHTAIAGLVFLFGWFTTTGLHQWQQSQVQPVTVTENISGGPATKTYQVSNEGSRTDADRFFNPLVPKSDLAFDCIASLYIIGVILMMARMGKSLIYTQKLRNSGIAVDDRNWQDHLDSLREHLLLDIPVTLQFSKMVDVPVVMGVLKPLILLPVTITSQLSHEQLEAILLHELAHIKRQDYLINIIQSIIETLMFFNPFMWIISAEIRKEREHCCDDLVVSCTENPLQYAHALAALEAGRNESLNLGLAATGKKQNLFYRIKRIMEMKSENYHYGKLVAAVLIVCGLGISALWLTPSFAQGKKNNDDKTKVWVSDERLTITDEYGKQHVYPTLEQWPEKERQRMVKEYAKDGMVMFFGPQNKQIVIDPQTGKTNITVAGKYAFSHPGPVSETAAPVPPVPPVPSFSADVPEDPEVPEIPEAAEVPEVPEPGDNDVNIDVDVDKVVSNALSSVNWDSIGNTVNVALKQVQNNVDWKAIDKDVRKGLKEAGKAMNDPKVRAEMRRAMSDAKKAMDQARIESRKQIFIARSEASKQAEAAREESRRAMDEARVEMQKARDEAAAQRRQDAAVRIQDVHARRADKNFDGMLDQMEDQGLINRDKKFKIEKTDGRLFINGEEQPSSVYNRYSHYLNHDEVHIKGNKSQLSISVTDTNDK